MLGRPAFHVLLAAGAIGCGGPMGGGQSPADLAAPTLNSSPPRPPAAGARLGRAFFNTADGAHVLTSEEGVLREMSQALGRLVRCRFTETSPGTFHCLPSSLSAVVLGQFYGDPACKLLVLQVAAGCVPPTFAFLNSGNSCSPRLLAYSLTAASPSRLYSLATGTCQDQGPAAPGTAYMAGTPADFGAFPTATLVFE